jgi:hypothetical protein
MAINPEIALGIRRQPLESPINKMAQVLQLQGMRDEAALRQAGMQRQNKLLELMGGAYEKPEMREEALLRGGFVKEANDLTKNRVDALKVQADTDKNRIDAAHKRVDSWGQAMGFVRQNPTLENAQAAVQRERCRTRRALMPSCRHRLRRPTTAAAWARRWRTPLLRARLRTPRETPLGFNRSSSLSKACARSSLACRR